jgi:hypothetical protein
VTNGQRKKTEKDKKGIGKAGKKKGWLEKEKGRKKDTGKGRIGRK